MKLRKLMESEVNWNDYSQAIDAGKRGFVLFRGHGDNSRHRREVETVPTVRTKSQYGSAVEANVSRFMDRVFDSWHDVSKWIPRRESIFCSTDWNTDMFGNTTSIVLFKNGARLNSGINDFNYSESWPYLNENYKRLGNLRSGFFHGISVRAIVNGWQKELLHSQVKVGDVINYADLFRVISLIHEKRQVDSDPIETYNILNDLVDPVKNGFKSFTYSEADDSGVSLGSEVWSNSPYILLSPGKWEEIQYET